MHILGVIPARGGSKRIPRKNVRELAGKPLIAFTIEEAQKSILDATIVSTEDDEIREISQRYGCAVIDRPEELAQDTSPTPPVIIHAVQQYENETGNYVDAVMTLQVTSPLRAAEDIDNAIKLFVKSGQDSLISVTDGVHPVKCYDKDKNPIMANVLFDRQKHGKVYVRNGAIFITRRDLLDDTSTLMGKTPEFYEMSRMHSVDIDTEEDFKMAEAICLYERGMK